MKRIIAAVTGLLLLSACGAERSGTITTEDGEEIDYTLDTDSGGATITAETEDGTATVRTGADVPVDLPSGFSIYPGAEVLNNVIIDREGDKGAMVSMTSDASAADMVAFYRKQAEAAGIKIETEVKTGAMTMIGGESESGTGFSFMATPNGDATNGQLMIGDKFAQ
ncbi:hypothetical protein QWY75_01535 [Pontixanthobacter aestiaquae]|uniref:Lipoprotein n=1 Tax=Pontixanthobacter aestiaquae TaxID=1509367 RepID=A0A844ZAR0_9SPHN|nr:hypothetical protein [Pontixanthobacter aestiaquae]MDN3644882.1 hypothetical protein [Pontixanthobacter aestiaquae]MXO84117.1 hypothetical protein [Pontixanthobacter aestiaquae]